MKLNLTCLSFIPLSFGILTNAQALEWSPHVGVDYKYWGAQSKAIYEPIFPHIEDGLSGYLGFRLDRRFNIDFGYDHGFQREKTTQFNGNTAYFGPNDALNDSVVINFRMKEYYVNFAYHYALESAPCFEIFTLIGAALNEPASTIYYIQGAGVQLPLDVENFWHVRFGFGAQYNFLKHLGIKASVFWEQTARIKYRGSNQINQQIEFKPYKNATNFSIGFVLFV